jgi:hypothetical protein
MAWIFRKEFQPNSVDELIQTSIWFSKYRK